MGKRKVHKIECRSKGAGWGLAERSWVGRTRVEEKFGGKLDWDPVLDPIRGRKRPVDLELWRMENWGKGGDGL